MSGKDIYICKNYIGIYSLKTPPRGSGRIGKDAQEILGSRKDTQEIENLLELKPLRTKAYGN